MEAVAALGAEFGVGGNRGVAVVAVVGRGRRRRRVVGGARGGLRWLGKGEEDEGEEDDGGNGAAEDQGVEDDGGGGEQAETEPNAAHG